MAKRQTENIIERECVAWIESLGGIAPKLVLFMGKGFPDRTILLPDKGVIFVEFKVPGGRISPHQAKWRKILQDLGFEFHVITSLAQLQRVLGY